MEAGRSNFQRKAYGQARSAFRRALLEISENRILSVIQATTAFPVAAAAADAVAEDASVIATTAATDRDTHDVALRLAVLERQSYLNQALSSQRLGETAPAEQQAEHWRDVLRACDTLLARHLADGKLQQLGAVPVSVIQDSSDFTPSPVLRVQLAAAASAEDPRWLAKTLFRRATAREKLGYISDACIDLEAALRKVPGDTDVVRRLQILQQHAQRVKLHPARMFSGVFERARAVQEQEEAEAAMAEKKKRKEARLQRLAVLA